MPVISAVRKLPGRQKVAGSKKAAAAAAVVVASPIDQDGVLASTADQRAQLPMYQREDARVLGGEALRDYAHELGLPRSTLNAEADDERVRMEIRYIENRKFEEAD